MTSQQTSSTEPAALCRSTFITPLTLGWMRKHNGRTLHQALSCDGIAAICAPHAQLKRPEVMRTTAMCVKSEAANG